MAKRGLGDKQVAATRRAKEKILSVLKNGELLRYKEIQERTGLSTATLTKHLKELEKGIIERYEDLETKEYPTPVYYKFNPYMLWEKKSLEAIFVPLKEENFEEKKSVSSFVEYLDVQMGLRLLANIRLYFDKNKNDVAFDQALDNYILAVYKEYANVLKEKFKILSDKGVSVQPLIEEAEKEILNHFKHLRKE